MVRCLTVKNWVADPYSFFADLIFDPTTSSECRSNADPDPLHMKMKKKNISEEKLKLISSKIEAKLCTCIRIRI